MAGKLFLGFDSQPSSVTLNSGATNEFSANSWARLIFPNGVYHNKGYPTRDQSIAPPNSGSNGSCISTARTGTIGAAYGCGLNVNGTSVTYTSGSTCTRTTWATAQGHQLALDRTELALGTELYFTWDACTGYLPTGSSLDATYQPTNSWAKMFVWGDVEVVAKQTTNTATSVHTLVFAVRNNGTEIATVTVPGISTVAQAQVYTFCSLYVKLDNTTGAIAFSVNGVAQTTPYTGQNTVTTIAAAAASAVYIGPIVYDNGTTSYVGAIDNLYIDDSAFPAGRLQIVELTIVNGVSAVDMVPFGTASTLAGTVSSGNDTKSLIASTTLNGASAVFTQSQPTMTTYLENLVGIEMVNKYAINRNPRTAYRVANSIVIANTETVAKFAHERALLFDSNTVSPASSQGRCVTGQVFTKVGGGNITKTDLPSVQIAVKSVTA